MDPLQSGQTSNSGPQPSSSSSPLGPEPSSELAEKERKQRRGWNVWTVADTRNFFTALAEHGKDFPAIQAYIQAKGSTESGKKQNKTQEAKNGKLSPTIRNDCLTLKTREQVRHYYYRMWHKISPALKDITLVKEADGQSKDVVVDKAILELYGLINYGEIWKKMGAKFSRKTKAHLKELVMEGTTLVRGFNKSKQTKSETSNKTINKNLKIKTPNCKALRRINGLETDGSSDPSSSSGDHGSIFANQKSLPLDVPVELLPLNYESFLRVQELAQNPRFKTRVQMSTRVSSFISFLESRKWNQDRFRKSQRESFAGSDDPDFVPFKPSSDEKCIHLKLHEKLMSSLETQATEGIKLLKPDTSENGTGPSSSLNLISNGPAPSFKQFLQNLKLNKIGPDHQFNKSKREPKNSKGISGEDKNDPVATYPSPDIINPVAEIEDSCCSTSSFTPFKETFKKLNQLNQVLQMVTHDTQKDNGIEMSEENVDMNQKEPTPIINPNPLEEEVSLPPENLNISQWLKLKEFKQTNNGHLSTPEKKRPDGNQVEENGLDARDDDPLLRITESVKSGWSVTTSSGMTFGELYLILKCPAKIILTYEFTKSVSNDSSQLLSITEQYLTERRNRCSLLNRVIEASIFALSINRKGCLNSGPLKQLQSVLSSQYNTPPKNRMSDHMTMSMTPNNCSPEGHNFLIPTAPAPRSVANTSTTVHVPQVFSSPPQADASQDMTGEKKNWKRQRSIVCEDPQAVQDALKQLNANKVMSRKKPRVIRPTTVGPVCNRELFGPQPHLPNQMFLRPTVSHLIGNNKQPLIITQANGSNHQLLTAHPQFQVIPSSVNSGLQLIASGPGVQSFQTLQPQVSSSLPLCLTTPTYSLPTLVLNGMNLPILTANHQLTASHSNILTSGTVGQNTAEVPVSTASNGHYDNSCVAVPSVMPLNQSSSTNVELIDLGTPTKHVPEQSETCINPSASEPSTSSASSFSMSSLLDFSLPEAPVVAPTGSSSVTSGLNPFFGENSCSSISDLISSFGQNAGTSQPGMINPSSGQMNNSISRQLNQDLLLPNSLRPLSTPNWLINEGSNSSLGISGLMTFGSNDGLV